VAYLQEIMSKFLAIVKPEAVEEVKEAMDHFASSL
jgi:nitrogen regulatory protein PII